VIDAAIRRALEEFPTAKARRLLPVGTVVLLAIVGSFIGLLFSPDHTKVSTKAQLPAKGGVGAVVPAATMADGLVDAVNCPTEGRSSGQSLGYTPYQTRLPVGYKVSLELYRDGSLPQSVNFDVLPVENKYDIRLLPAP